MRTTTARTLCLASAFASACLAQAAAPVYKLLYSPSPGDTIGDPVHLAEVQPSLLYALDTLIEGTSGGTIISVTTAGAFRSIYSFPGANNNNAETLVQATNSDLYGAGFSASGYYYFSMSTSGTDFKQFPFPGNFPNQWGPFNETIVAPPGEMYDLASIGTPYVYGLARIEEAGKITIVHKFSASEGIPRSNSPIIYGPDGNVYGIANETTSATSPGFIYRITPVGVYSKLLTFPSFPKSGFGYFLVAGLDGNLYGTFPIGGTNNTGYIYQATLSGQYQVVANFPAKGMTQPDGSLLAAADGNVYGSTNSNDIFRYELATKQLSKIYTLQPSQGRCYCQLIEGMDGKLYGDATTGGNIGAGAIFSLDIGLPEPLPLVSGLYPSGGSAGQQVILWGDYLLGATSVTFNGTAAPGAISTSKQSVLVSVPAGATTGPVTVTTANGTFTTTQSFTVQ